MNYHTINQGRERQREHTPGEKSKGASSKLPNKDAAPEMPETPHSLATQPTRFCSAGFLGEEFFYRNNCVVMFSSSGAEAEERQRKEVTALCIQSLASS